MSLIDDYLNQVGQKKLTTPWTLYSGDVANPLTPLSAVPTQDFRIRILATSSGTCVITGSLDGTPKTETLSVVGGTSKNGTYTFDSLSSISCTCPTGTITVTCIDTNAATINQITYADFDCRWEDVQTTYMNSSGAWAQSNAKVMAKALYVANDVIRKYGTTTEFPIKKVKLSANLPGEEEFRVFLL
jgi:hypothetical protein